MTNTMNRLRSAPGVALAALLLVVGVLPAAIAAAAGPAAPSPTVVSLTFDDGSAEQYATKDVMAARGMAGTFFINSGRVGSAGYMTQSQLSTLAAAGNEIGGHTVSHSDLPTVSVDEQQRQVCNDRVSLLGMGFQVTNFAYPYGDTNAGVESVVQACGYNSARVVGGLVSPKTCSGCAYAEAVPPADPYAMMTPDSLQTPGYSLSDMQTLVTQAEQHGGGWVQLVIHRVCDGCSGPYTISTADFTALLDWLQTRSPSGTTVKTVQQVIGGPVRPGVSGPPATPPPSTNLLRNPGLETDANGDKVPDCWTLGGFGANSATWSRVSSAHGGSWAEKVTVSGYVDGDRKLVSTMDLGSCAPPAVVGHIYSFSSWYQSTVPVRAVAYYRSSSGGWVWWAQSDAVPASAGWAKVNWTTPALPAGATAVSVGLSIRANGSMTLDDLSLLDSDTTAPSVQLTSPADGSVVRDTVLLGATASDQGGVSRVDFLLDGALVGSSTTAPYQYSWDTTKTTDGSVAIAARAYDRAGNQATSQSVLVAVGNSIPVDRTSPTSSVTCNGGPCTTAWSTQPVSMGLTAIDGGSGVARTTYTVDGSDPTGPGATVYAGPFMVTAPQNVRYSSTDNAGNVEYPQSIQLNVDTVAPQTVFSCAGSSCLGTTYAKSVSVSLIATDAASGIAQTLYTLDGSDPAGPAGLRYTQPIVLDQTSATVITARSIDVAGNVEPARTVTVSVDANPATDGSPPQTTITCGGASCGSWSTSAVPVVLTALDSGSGVATTWYTVDGTDPGPANGSVYSGTFTVASSAQIRFRSIDVAGNLEPVQVAQIQIDGVAPTSAILCNLAPCGTAPLPSASVSFTASDDNSGVSAIRYTLDGSDPASSTLVATGPVPVTSTSVVKFRAVDVAGNAQATQAVLVTIGSPDPVVGPEKITNASLETDANADSLPDCWQFGGFGTNAFTWSRTADSHSGGFAEKLSISSLTDGDRRFLTKRDAGACSPSGVVGHTYRLTGWYKSTAPVYLVTYYLDPTGSWVYWVNSSALPAAPAWTQATLTTPALPTGATLLNVGVSLRAVGSVTLDDFSLKDNDQTAPVTTVACNGQPCSMAAQSSPVSVSLAATDAGGGITTRYTTDGSDPTRTNGTTYGGPFPVSAATTVRFRSYDGAGNAEAVKGQYVAVTPAAPPPTTTTTSTTSTTTTTSTTSTTTTSTTTTTLPVQHAAFSRPLASIEFDDGWGTAYRSGLPTVESFGWRPTQYVITDTAANNAAYGSGTYMTPAEVVDWNRRGDVGAHTVTHPHLPTLSQAAMTTELTASKTYLDSLLGEPTRLFATPYCETNAAITTLAASLYQSLRNCDISPNTQANFDRYNLKCFIILNTTTDAEITSFLNDAKASNGWAVLTWHEIRGDNVDTYSVSQATLQRQLQLVKDSGIAVVPTQQALNEELGL